MPILIWISNYQIYKVGQEIDPTDESLALLGAMKPNANSLFPFNAITSIIFRLNFESIALTRTTAITLLQILIWISFRKACKINFKQSDLYLQNYLIDIISIPLSYIATALFYQGFYLRFPSYDWLNAICILSFVLISQNIYLNKKSINNIRFQVKTTLLISFVIFFSSFSKPSTSLYIYLLAFIFAFKNYGLKLALKLLFVILFLVTLLFLLGYETKFLPDNIFNQFFMAYKTPKWVPNNTTFGALLDLIKFPIYPYYLMRHNLQIFLLFAIIFALVIYVFYLKMRSIYDFSLVRIIFFSSITLLASAFLPSKLFNSQDKAISISFIFILLTFIVIVLRYKKFMDLDLAILNLVLFFDYVIFGFGSAHGVAVRSYNFAAILFILILMNLSFEKDLNFRMRRACTFYIVICFSLMSLFLVSSYKDSFRIDFRNNDYKIFFSNNTFIFSTKEKYLLYKSERQCAKKFYDKDTQFVSLYYRTPWFSSLPFYQYHFGSLSPTLMGYQGSLDALAFTSARYINSKNVVFAVNGEDSALVRSQNNIMLNTFLEGAKFSRSKISARPVCTARFEGEGNNIEGLSTVNYFMIKN